MSPVGREQLVKINIPQISDKVPAHMDPASEKADVFRNILFALIAVHTVIFLREGRIMLQESVDTIRNEKGKSVDALFREVFAC